MARLAGPTAATVTTLAVIADPHVGLRSEGTSKPFGRTEQQFNNVIDDIPERDGMRHSVQERLTDSVTARGLTAIALDRLARFPVVGE